ncbi:MAG: YdcF family protein [Gammaproteobacteria bacterium]|nr:YdcF family protein [Gammaproteobacteria bacterium]MCK5092658.1 YdcF family protein [Gammaproteobacteria bacterium]
MEEFLKYFIYPSNLITIAILAGIILLIFRARKAALTCLVLSLALYIIFGSGQIAFMLLSDLEYRYPPLDLDNIPMQIDTIVVLTGDADDRPEIPSSSKINSASAFRILEAVRIQNKLQKSRIVITGLNQVPVLMKEVVKSLGIPEELITIETQSSNTSDSASHLKTLLGNKPFILVTSAGHMPRAMAVFNYYGLESIAAPTNYLSKKNILAARYLPTAHHLAYSDLAIHEHLAIAWYKLTGKIRDM